MKIKGLILFSALLISLQIRANDSEKLLAKVISNFKTASTKGYSTKYYGLGKMSSEHKFEGDVRLSWSQNEKLSLDGIRVKGDYLIKDVLGKRDENVDIYLLKNEFWKVFHEQKQFLYSPNLEATLSNTFSKVYPLLIVEALSFMQEHKGNLKQVSSEDGDNLIGLSSSYEEVHYTIWIDGANDIKKVSWTKDKWGEGEIIGEIDTQNPSSIKGEFEKPVLNNYQKKMIPTIGYAAPAWESAYYTGGKVSLDDFKGKVLLMDFWATWCSPCVRAIPALEKMHQKFSDKGLVTIGLNYHERRKNPGKFMTKLRATYPIIKAETIGLDYGILNWPTTFIIDKKGVIRDAFFGYHGEETDNRIEQKVTILLDE